MIGTIKDSNYWADSEKSDVLQQRSRKIIYKVKIGI